MIELEAMENDWMHDMMMNVFTAHFIGKRK
jgi:hypothetical protein